MKLGIIGKKVGMTRVYSDQGTISGVTAILAEPNVVLQLIEAEKNGYNAIQVGVFDKKESRVKKPLLGHFKKAGVTPKSLVQEWRLEKEESKDLKVGDEIKVDIFKPGMWVDVIAQSKGKGFQGVVKRHGFSGGRASHGSKMHRRPGGIAQGSTPGTVRKNKPMPGHMGNVRITTQNLEVVQVRLEDNVILVKGSVPGARSGYVVVRPAVKGQPKTKQQGGKADGKKK